MDVMQLTNDNSDVKAEDERSVGEGLAPPGTSPIEATQMRSK